MSQDDLVPAGYEHIELASGTSVDIPKCFIQFKKWVGEKIKYSCGNKPVIDFEGEPLFAELAALRVYMKTGWNGVWVDNYCNGGGYRTSLPKKADSIVVELPAEIEKMLDSIKKVKSKHPGCWDVLLWKKDNIKFVELKRLKPKDILKDSQKKWLELALLKGISSEAFLLLEWQFQ